MGIFDRLTTRHVFDDGVKISLLHKYALKVEFGSRCFDIGFEQALDTKIDRLIHQSSITEYLLDGTTTTSIDAIDRKEILDRVIRYCEIKDLKYEIVS